MRLLLVPFFIVKIEIRIIWLVDESCPFALFIYLFLQNTMLTAPHSFDNMGP